MAVAVTLFIVGDDDDSLATPEFSVPSLPVAVAVTLFIVGDDETLRTP